MDLPQMLAMLNGSGIPFVYHIWRKPPALPWGVVTENTPATFYADGEPYYMWIGYTVELYTAKKEPKTEKRLEDTLLAAGITYQKYESYIESERLYQITYECEV